MGASPPAPDMRTEVRRLAGRISAIMDSRNRACGLAGFPIPTAGGSAPKLALVTPPPPPPSSSSTIVGRLPRDSTLSRLRGAAPPATEYRAGSLHAVTRIPWSLDSNTESP